jgi:hypothetical protein
MKSYLVSALKRQFGSSRDLFFSRNGNEWLVWEPGSWKAPRSSTLVLEAPPLPPAAAPPSKAAEALAIGLPGSDRVRVGRAPDVEISLNDGTLSGTHFALLRDGGRWSAEDLGSTNGTFVENVRLKAGERMTLRNGSSIRAGSVMLTFHTAEGLWARLSE